MHYSKKRGSALLSASNAMNQITPRPLQIDWTKAENVVPSYAHAVQPREKNNFDAEFDSLELTLIIPVTKASAPICQN